MKEYLFIKSLKEFNPNLIHTTLIDFVYVALFFAIGIFASMLLNVAFDYTVNSYTLFIIILILLTVLTYFLVALNMAFFKNMTWNITLGKKRKFAGFLKFTLVWTFPWLIIFYLLRNSLPEPLQVFILTAYALVYLHFTAMARLSYKKSIKKTFSEAFDIGFWKFPKFIGPYALILASVWVISFLTSFLVYLGTTIFIVVSFVVFFVMIAWSRYYISLVYSEIK